MEAEQWRWYTSLQSCCDDFILCFVCSAVTHMLCSMVFQVASFSAPNVFFRLMMASFTGSGMLQTNVFVVYTEHRVVVNKVSVFENRTVQTWCCSWGCCHWVKGHGTWLTARSSKSLVWYVQQLMSGLIWLHMTHFHCCLLTLPAYRI